MKRLEKYTVFPGQYIITTVPTLITTVLGSCVAVCLWDRESLTGGMNHYLLPGTSADDLSNSNRGIGSTRLLVRSMLNRGVKRSNIEAKLFGGCNSLYRDNDVYKVGERNVAIAFDILKEFDIPVLANHIGGCYGRKIVFNSATGKVRMRLLVKSALEINEEINKGFGH